MVGVVEQKTMNWFKIELVKNSNKIHIIDYHTLKQITSVSNSS